MNALNYADVLAPPKWTHAMVLHMVGSALLVCSMLFLIVTRYLHRPVVFKLQALAVCVAALNNLVSHLHWRAWVDWPETMLVCSVATWMLLVVVDELHVRCKHGAWTGRLTEKAKGTLLAGIALAGAICLFSGCHAVAPAPHAAALRAPAVTREVQQIHTVTHEVQVVRQYVVKVVTNLNDAAFLTNRINSIEERLRDTADALTFKDVQLRALDARCEDLTTKYNGMVDLVMTKDNDIHVRDGRILELEKQLSNAATVRQKSIVRWGGLGLLGGLLGTFGLKMLFR